jgi:hypothetical protein
METPNFRAVQNACFLHSDTRKPFVRNRPRLCRLAGQNEWHLSGDAGSSPNGDNGG